MRLYKSFSCLLLNAAAKGAHGSRSDPALVGARKIRTNSDQKEWVVAGGRRGIECPRKFRIATRVQRHWKRGENGLILLARIANQRALNEVFNARDFFAPPCSRKPEFRRNQFGATVGGPILHARTFFFTDYQGSRQAIGITRISTVPTLAQRQGNFSGQKIFDPTTTPPNGSGGVKC